MKNYNSQTISGTYEGASMPRQSNSNDDSVYWELYFSAEHKGERLRFYVPADSSMENFNAWYHVVKTGTPGDVYELMPFVKKCGNAHIKNGMYLCDADNHPTYKPSILEQLFNA